MHTAIVWVGLGGGGGGAVRGGSFRMNKRQTIKAGIFLHDIYKQLESRRRSIEIERRNKKL